MSRLLIILFLATACANAAHSTDHCDQCMKVAESLRSVPAGALRSGAITTADLCASQPASSASVCADLMENGFPNRQTSAQACGELGLCSGAGPKDKGMSGLRDDANCPLCEYLVVLIQSQLDPETEKFLIGKVEEACAELPEDMQSSCLQYIAAAGKQFFDWVQVADPGTVCDMVGMCGTQSPTLLSASVRGNLNRLQTGDGDQCNTCQLVIIEASAILSDPSTQKEILDYVKQSCKDFKSFEEQCESYVELYGPTVLNVAKQYLKPELCTQLGFCDPSFAA